MRRRSGAAMNNEDDLLHSFVSHTTITASSDPHTSRGTATNGRQQHNSNRRRRSRGGAEAGDDDDDDDDDLETNNRDGLVLLRPADGIATISSSSSSASTQSILTPVTLCILGTETAERFAYFGFRAVLVLYFTRALEYTESEAIALFSFNSSLAYFSPLLGAVLADGWWGRYRVILHFGGIYCVGLAILTASAAAGDWDVEWKRGGTFAGLFLVCVGTGGIKPCVSAFGADQVYLAAAAGGAASGKEGTDDEGDGEGGGGGGGTTDDTNHTPPERSEQVRTFFNYFYFCINVGAVTSIALVPILRSLSGFGLAFFFPCLFMMGAMLLFLSKRREYIHQPIGTDNRMLQTFRLMVHLLMEQLFFHCPWMNRHCGRFRPEALVGPRRLVPTTDRSEELHSGEDDDDDDNDNKPSGLVPSSALYNEMENDETNNTTEEDDEENDAEAQRWKDLVDDARQTLNILPVLLMFPIFWTLYDQQGSVWTLQATRMYLPLGMQPEQMNIVNPVEILIFVPLFDQIVYPRLEGRGVNIAPVKRMAWGMVLAAIAFFVSALVESSIQRREQQQQQVNVFWQLPQITILAVAEILLSVTGLEFSYACSPDRLKAAITALFLCTTGIGDVFSGILYSTVFENMNRATAMHVCALLMLGNLRLFLWVAKWYEGREEHHLQQQQEERDRRKSTNHRSLPEEATAEFEMQNLQRRVV